MMSNLFNLTAKQIGNDLVLEYWETPKPNGPRCSRCDDTGTMNELYGCRYCNPGYEWKSTISNTYKRVQWLSQKKTVKVHPDCVDEIKSQFYLYCLKSIALISGIYCDFLKDRIEIIDGYAILKPIKSEEETQDELWDEVLRIERSKGNKLLNESLLSSIKSKFTIKRKGG